MILSGLTFIAGAAIASAGKQELSESVQKILLNYFQVAAMIRIFPLRWPPELEGLFDFQGAVSTVGEHLVNPDCVTSSATAAELFYSKRATFAFLPLLVVLLAFAFWYVYGVVRGVPFFDKRTKSASGEPSSTPKDKFVVTVGAVLYLMFPTLVGGTFQMFDCRAVGDARFLSADMEESCDGDRYALMMPLLGVSQLILYVCGLPLLMLWFLIRNRRRLQAHVVQCRYGLFFAGYKESRFYWESVLSARKISIVGLGVFGPSLGPVRQSEVAMLILFFFIVVELLGNPFSEPTQRHRVLAKLELAALVVLFLTMWSGTMIFSSAEVDDRATVQVLTVVVVLVTVAMMAWLFAQLAKECAHEKRETAARVRSRVNVFRRRISMELRRRRTTETDVEMRQWAANPMTSAQEKENEASL